LQKCGLDGSGQLSGSALIELRGRIHHDKKREQQGDKVGVRHQPPVAVRRAR
jgi:hypothetical protein